MAMLASAPTCELMAGWLGGVAIGLLPKADA